MRFPQHQHGVCGALDLSCRTEECGDFIVGLFPPFVGPPSSVRSPPRDGHSSQNLPPRDASLEISREVSPPRPLGGSPSEGVRPECTIFGDSAADVRMTQDKTRAGKCRLLFLLHCAAQRRAAPFSLPPLPEFAPPPLLPAPLCSASIQCLLGEGWQGAIFSCWSRWWRHFFV